MLKISIAVRIVRFSPTIVIRNISRVVVEDLRLEHNDKDLKSEDKNKDKDL